MSSKRFNILTGYAGAISIVLGNIVHGVIGSLLSILGAFLFFWAAHLEVKEYYGKRYRYLTIAVGFVVIVLSILASLPDQQFVVVSKKINEPEGTYFRTISELRFEDPPILRNLTIEAHGNHIIDFSVYYLRGDAFILTDSISISKSLGLIAFANAPAGTYKIEITTAKPDSILIKHKDEPLIPRESPKDFWESTKVFFSKEIPLYIILLLLIPVVFFWYKLRKIKTLSLDPDAHGNDSDSVSEPPVIESPFERERLAKDVYKENTAQKLKYLSGNEKRVLNEFLSRNSKTHVFKFPFLDFAIVNDLVKEGILEKTRPDNVFNILEFDNTYRINQTAWEILKDNPDLIK